jgi:hypothetical protein
MADKKDITVPDLPPPGSDKATWMRFGVTLLTVLLTAFLTWYAQKPQTVVVQPPPPVTVWGHQ